MSETRNEATALAVFDALCALRARDLIDAQLIGELADALAGAGRAAELVTRYVAPSRARVLAQLGADEHDAKLGDGVPAGVLELVIALLPSLPPLPRHVVAPLLGSPLVRAEVRRMLEETVRELMGRATGGRGERPRGVISWGARAAASAGGRVVGAVGGMLGADLEARIGDAVELGVSLAQRRLVDAVSSPESARRVGKEAARLVPRLAEIRERDVARFVAGISLSMVDGLVASILAHNAARPKVRALVVAEAATIIAQASEITLGELLDRFGARAPLRAATARLGGHVVAAVAARLPG